MAAIGGWNEFLHDLGRSASYLQLGLLLVTLPLWSPIARALWRELDGALDPEGGIFGMRRRRAIAPRPLHLDPFANLPRRPPRAARREAAARDVASRELARGADASGTSRTPSRGRGFRA